MTKPELEIHKETAKIKEIFNVNAE